MDMPQLRDVDLGDNAVSLEGAKALAPYLATVGCGFGKKKKLDVAGSMPGAKHQAPPLPGLLTYSPRLQVTELKHLRLNNTGVGPAGGRVRHLFAATNGLSTQTPSPPPPTFPSHHPPFQ